MPEKKTPASAAPPSAESFADRIKKAIANATTLQVVTSVGPVARDDNGDPELIIGDESKIMLTRYDLVDGDITTVMDPTFVDGPYDKLREFHQKQVDTGLQQVSDNIDALKKLYELARSIF